jgi:hypothetical protein
MQSKMGRPRILEMVDFSCETPHKPGFWLFVILKIEYKASTDLVKKRVDLAAFHNVYNTLRRNWTFLKKYFLAKKQSITPFGEHIHLG